MIQIFVRNDDVAKDVFATVTDLNTAMPVVVVRNQRINRGGSVAATVQEDGNGNCLINVAVVDATDAGRAKAFDNQSCGDGQTIPVDLFGV